MRRHAHAGENRDIDFRVSEEPEQMLPQDRRTAAAVDDLIVDDQPGRDEEARAEVAVEQQQDTGGEQNTEGQQAEDGGYEPGPDRERQAHHGEALGP